MISWSNITLDIWIECMNIITDDSISDDDKELNVLSIVLDRPLEEIENMPWEDLEKLDIDSSFFIGSVPQHEAKLVIDGVELVPIRLNKLEFGAFIDLEAILSNPNGYLNDLPRFFSILFRAKLLDHSTLYVGQVEKYGDWARHRSHLMSSQPITKLYHTLIEYMEFRKKLFNSYKGLFEEKEDLSNDDLTGLSAKEREEIQKTERIQKWGWELLLLKLTVDQPLMIDKATEMPILEALNLLSMYQELSL